MYPLSLKIKYLSNVCHLHWSTIVSPSLLLRFITDGTVCILLLHLCHWSLQHSADDLLTASCSRKKYREAASDSIPGKGSECLLHVFHHLYCKESLEAAALYTNCSPCVTACICRLVYVHSTNVLPLSADGLLHVFDHELSILVVLPCASTYYILFHIHYYIFYKQISNINK